MQCTYRAELNSVSPTRFSPSWQLIMRMQDSRPTATSILQAATAILAKSGPTEDNSTKKRSTSVVPTQRRKPNDDHADFSSVAIIIVTRVRPSGSDTFCGRKRCRKAFKHGNHCRSRFFRPAGTGTWKYRWKRSNQPQLFTPSRPALVEELATRSSRENSSLVDGF